MENTPLVISQQEALVLRVLTEAVRAASCVEISDDAGVVHAVTHKILGRLIEAGAVQDKGRGAGRTYRITRAGRGYAGRAATCPGTTNTVVNVHRTLTVGARDAEVATVILAAVQREGWPAEWPGRWREVAAARVAMSDMPWSVLADVLDLTKNQCTAMFRRLLQAAAAEGFITRAQAGR